MRAARTSAGAPLEPLLLALGGRFGGFLGWLRFRFGHCYASFFRGCPRGPRKGL